MKYDPPSLSGGCCSLFGGYSGDPPLEALSLPFFAGLTALTVRPTIAELSLTRKLSNSAIVGLTVNAVNPAKKGREIASYGGSADYPPKREQQPPDKEGGSYFKSQYGVEVGKIQGMKNHWFLDTAQRSPGATLSLFADLGQINSHNYAFQTQIKINFVSSINEIIDDDSLKFDLSEVKNSKLMEIIQKFKSLIAKNNFDLGSSAILKHTIDVQGNPRISSRPNRPPFKQKGERNRHIDFLGPIRPISRQSYSYLMVVHDYLIKWIKAIPKPNLLAYTTANALIDHVIPVHGTPKAILADKDRYFTLNSLNNICLCFGINRTIACCPESFDRTLMMVLKPYVGHVHDDWEVLQLVCFASVHSSTYKNPHFLMYGRNSPLLFLFLYPRFINIIPPEDNKISHQNMLWNDKKMTEFHNMDDSRNIRKLQTHHTRTTQPVDEEEKRKKTIPLTSAASPIFPYQEDSDDELQADQATIQPTTHPPTSNSMDRPTDDTSNCIKQFRFKDLIQLINTTIQINYYRIV